jgi:pantothenate kinase
MLPSSFTILTTNVSIPILGGISSAGGYIQTISTTLTQTVFAFLILSLISSGRVAIMSAALFLLSGAAFAKILIYSTIVFSWLGVVFHLAAAIGVTAIIAIANTVINTVGNNLGVYSYMGTKFLIMIWVAWALIFISALYWGTVWFVEIRTYAIKARYRTSQEIGDYRGTFLEVADDFRRPKNESEPLRREYAESLGQARRESQNLDTLSGAQPAPESSRWV